MKYLLRVDQIKAVRTQKAAKNKYKCPICDMTMTSRMALDHCHKTGHVRDTICNACNRAEGKLLKSLTHYTMRKIVPSNHPMWTDTTKWLKSLADYLNKHKENPSNMIHPTFDIEKNKQK